MGIGTMDAEVTRPVIGAVLEGGLDNVEDMTILA